MKLYGPSSYWELTAKERKKRCNGCGAANACFDFVPDTIWGLRISAACNIHDYMYGEGKAIEDKEAADRAMLNNMIRIIDAKTKWRWLRKLRKRRAHKYYWAVNKFGASAFWDGKNKASEIGFG